MTETEVRFLRAIGERVAVDRVAEVFLFPVIRQGQVDSGVAVIAEAPVPPETEDAPEGKYIVYRAMFRHTVKGPDRGAWACDVTVEADAPLDAVSAVVHGVQRRSAVAAEPARLSGDEFRAVVVVASATAPVSA